MDDMKGMKMYWKLKEEAPDCSLSRTRFGKEYEPVERQSTK